MPFPEYIAYFDECGDHGLSNIDQNFPVFVLMGAVFKVSDYLQHELHRFNEIKFDLFGHDALIFHSHSIRKQIGPFSVLQNAQKRQDLGDAIANFFTNSKVTLIAGAIKKTAHKGTYKYPDNPYDLVLLFCLERLYGYLEDLNTADRNVTCIFESRGKKEDGQLAKTFASICGGANQWGKLPFTLQFATKQTNMIGLQIADLAAYPTARHIMDGNAANPAYDAIKPRFRRSKWGYLIGWGLKVFP